MPGEHDPWNDERLLYLWVRVFGAIILLVALVLAAAALIILPALNEDYRIGEGTAAVILGTLAASALALVEVQLRLWRRNGNGK